MESEEYKLFKGPAITWNKDDVTRMVEHFGKEAAIERLTEGRFKRSYVYEMVNMLIDKEYLENIPKPFSVEEVDRMIGDSELIQPGK